MAISKIKTGSITDSAVNTDKLAPGSVGSTDLSATVITGQTELSETAADTDFTIIYDTSAGALKKILRSNLKQAGPTISSISPTNANEADTTTTFTITGTGFTSGSNARLISNNGIVVEFDTVTRTSTTSITAVITNSNLSNSEEPYDVQVTNGEGISSLLANQINFNASPVFVTAAGSLGTFTDAIRANISVSVNATDPDSAGNVTFELQSGSLPPGLSLTNTAAEGGTAVISGTATAVGGDTTSTFTLRAVDNASNTSSRTFTITILAPVQQSFTSSGTFSVPAGVTAVNVLVVAGGGAGKPNMGGGGGAGGLVYVPGFPVTPSGTVTVTVGCGGSATGGPAGPGQDSAFGTITAKGGGYGSGNPGGSGGGASHGSTSNGTATQPTEPGQSGAYGFGNPGGQGSTVTYTLAAGGGGGAGTAGTTANAGTPQVGCGGDGKAYTIADGTTPVYYAGGGGGGYNRGHPTLYFPATTASGGQGGGGDATGSTEAPGGQPGPAPKGAPGQSGQGNKGGGGAGGAWENSTANTPNQCGGNGGKGIVIVAY